MQAGGKGWNIGRLHRYGFPVPPGGVLAASAYREFLSHNRLEPLVEESIALLSLDSLSDPDCIEVLKTLRTTVGEGDLPPHIRAEVKQTLQTRGLLHHPLAVRSSATCEDSPDASFAGIHDSYLNVTGIEAVFEAVKKCYASLWTERAVAYRRKMGIADEAVAQAVVVMEMVKARAAGVAFSCDPRTGSPEEMVINANVGLGESVVSGRVEPDEYRVNGVGLSAPAIIGKRLGKREKPGGGDVEFVTDTDHYALSDEEIGRLGLLVAAIYTSLGASERHQDIEWAFDGADFTILQARPVTALPGITYPAIAGQPVIWSNANFRDGVPGVISELTWSGTREIAHAILNASLIVAHYSWLKGRSLTRRFHGRGYFNLSMLQWELYDAFNLCPAQNERISGRSPAGDQCSHPGSGSLEKSV